MKKIVTALFNGFFLVSVAAGTALAVWPPETALEEDQKTVSSSTHLDSSSDQKKLMEKLTKDERQLGTLLGNLKKDEEDLRELKKQYESQISSTTPAKDRPAQR